MKDNLQIELLGKLAAEKEIARLLKERKRDEVTESIRPQHLAAYEEDGWKLDKEFKYTVRVKKEKPLDIKFEDEVWSLFAQLGFNFLNRDRQFHIGVGICQQYIRNRTFAAIIGMPAFGIRILFHKAALLYVASTMEILIVMLALFSCRINHVVLVSLC